jgi:hypothetical protein
MPMGKCLPRPSRRLRKMRKGRPFYWSAGRSPSTPRGGRRQAARDEPHARHARLVWYGEVSPQ